MTSSTTVLLRYAHSALARVVAADPQGAAESDDELLASTELTEDVFRLVAIVQARRAAEISRRSRFELGLAGLASSRGEANATTLVRAITRSTFVEAKRRIEVGAMLNVAGTDTTTNTELENSKARDAAASDPESAALAQAGRLENPTAALLADAVADGSLGIDATHKVMRILEPVVTEVDPDQLVAATATLIVQGATIDTNEVESLARGVRDSLHRVGVADREQHLRSKRALKRGVVRDGLRYVSLVLDPESDVRLVGTIDAIMSPRLGGPRFTEQPAKEAAQQLVDDPRSNEQIALDVLVDLVTAGASADPAVMPAPGPPVRVTMTIDDLVSRVDERTGHEASEITTGVAMVEGHPELISAATARRFLCNQGAIPIVLDGASVPLDVGRSRRFFTPGQRVALAVRDRGCRWPGCDRPPSWTEAHHIDEYQHGGKTDLRDGIMLCRRHHQLLHNAGWHITKHHPTRHHPNHQSQRDHQNKRDHQGQRDHQSERDHQSQRDLGGAPSHTPGHDPDPGFWLRPPATFDRQQQPIPMPPKGKVPGG